MEIEADEFVLCAGSWSAHLAQSLGLDLPLQAGKGYSLTLERPGRVPGHCAILTEARVAVTPLAGALRFAGPMEIAGLSEEMNPERACRTITLISVPRTSTAPGCGAGCVPARRTVCRTLGALPAAPISSWPPATR
jgi:glycine/D-amino acid oxidase-like deaminating enzyme